MARYSPNLFRVGAKESQIEFPTKSVDDEISEGDLGFDGKEMSTDVAAYDLDESGEPEFRDGIEA